MRTIYNERYLSKAYRMLPAEGFRQFAKGVGSFPGEQATWWAWLASSLDDFRKV